jgi:TDG/mug DNA glycosylase family protein
MKTEQINIRLTSDLVGALEQVAREEATDRATVIRRLLEASLRQWQVDRAIEGYRRGELSLGRAAEEADLTQWELIELLRDSHVAYPLEPDELPERIREMGSDVPAESQRSLPDIPPRPGGVLLVGINPAEISVAAGHYYQGRLGQRLWRRLEALGLLTDPVPGREDEAFARAGHGLTDLVKRPTKSAAELRSNELGVGIDDLRRKVREWRPSLVLFPYATAARRVLGSATAPGSGPVLEGVPTFLLSGPYARTAEARRIDDELRSLLGEASAPGDQEWTQRVTENDLTQGQLRLKQRARRLFPSGRTEVEIVLRGERVSARYDPRLGSDRRRSPVLRVGRERLQALVKSNEQLRLTRGRAGIVRIE